MNKQTRKVVQQALEALERIERYGDTFLCRSHEQKPYDQVCEAIDALNQLLEAEPLQEPDDSDINQVHEANAQVRYETWTPPAQTAVPLTVDEVNSIMAHDYTTATMPGRAGFIAGFRAAEVAYGITAAPKNGGAA